MNLELKLKSTLNFNKYLSFVAIHEVNEIICVVEGTYSFSFVEMAHNYHSKSKKGKGMANMQFWLFSSKQFLGLHFKILSKIEIKYFEELIMPSTAVMYVKQSMSVIESNL